MPQPPRESSSVTPAQRPQSASDSVLEKQPSFLALRHNILLLPYDIWTYILPYCAQPQLRALSTTCKAAHAFFTPFLLHTIVIRRPAVLQSFCFFVQMNASARGALIRSLSIHRRALLYGDTMLVDILAHARLLEEVILDESEHITRRYGPLTRALARCPRLNRLILFVGPKVELQRESTASTDSTLGLLKAHRQRLRSLTLGGAAIRWDWPPDLIWPHVTELVLLRCRIPAETIAYAFPNLVKLRCTQSRLDTPDSLCPTISLHALHTLTVDEFSLRSFRIGSSVHTLSIITSPTDVAGDESYTRDDPNHGCDSEELVDFIREAQPAVAILSLIFSLPNVDWKLLAPVGLSLEALEVDFHSAVDTFAEFMENFGDDTPLYFLHVRIPADESLACELAEEAFSKFSRLQFFRLSSNFPDAHASYYFTCHRREGELPLIEAITEDLGIAIQRESLGSII